MIFRCSSSLNVARAAVNAAEAGLNWYANQLGTSGVTAIGNAGLGWTVPAASCDAAGTAITATCWYVFSPTNATASPQATVATVPEKATFEIRVLYSSQNPCKDPSGALNTGAARQCGLANVPVRPSAWTTTNGVTALSQTGILQLVDTAAKPFPDTAYAIVRSTGIVGTVKRTLESYIRVRAIRGNLQGGLASISMCMGQSAKVNVYGDLSVNNEAVGGARPYAFSTNCADTYATGDLVIGGQGGSLTLLASGDAGGSLTIRGGGVTVKGNAPFSIARDVWAEGSVAIGTGTSALSACPLSGTIQCVGGDAIGSAVTVGSNAYVAGDTIICKYYVMATGTLSVPKEVDIDGVKRFQGKTYLTSRWPHEGVDFTGKRVAVIGTGSSAIQSIPIIASQAKQLTVFQRTPNFSIPAHNGPMPKDVFDDWQKNRKQYREEERYSAAGVRHTPTTDMAVNATPEERRKRYEEAWAYGGLVEFPHLGRHLLEVLVLGKITTCGGALACLGDGLVGLVALLRYRGLLPLFGAAAFPGPGSPSVRPNTDVQMSVMISSAMPRSIAAATSGALSAMAASVMVCCVLIIRFSQNTPTAPTPFSRT
mgnify:CR=1 FL=1